MNYKSPNLIFRLVCRCATPLRCGTSIPRKHCKHGQKKEYDNSTTIYDNATTDYQYVTAEK